MVVRKMDGVLMKLMGRIRLVYGKILGGVGGVFKIY
jgi:hypothetical protein